jgi:hypothetical protein
MPVIHNTTSNVHEPLAATDTLDINADQAQDLSGKLISTDAGNELMEGADGLLFNRAIENSPTEPVGAPDWYLWRNTSGAVVACIPPGGIGYKSGPGWVYLAGGGNKCFHARRVTPIPIAAATNVIVSGFTELSPAYFGSYNPGTGEFTVQCDGVYSIDWGAFLRIDVGAADSPQFVCRISVNGVFVANASQSPYNAGSPATSTLANALSRTLPLVTGDVVAPVARIASAAGTNAAVFASASLPADFTIARI